MRSAIITFALISMSFFLYSCGSAPEKLIVAKYGDNDITLDEFEQAYSKSAGVESADKKNSIDDMKNFLDLYVNFKMKLRDAAIRGYDTDPDVIKEIDSYKKQVGKNYIIEKYITDPGLRDLYNKRKWEFRISHLMIGTDTLSPEQAKQKVVELIKRIKNGEGFEELVKKYSDDKGSKDNGGDIYYFTAGEFLPDFEDAIYSTPVGQIYPEPVQSKIGYHIIKVTEKHERVPGVRVRHILAMTKKNEETGQVDTVEAYEKIKKAYDELKQGKDFNEVAKEYSDDKRSAEQGGDIGFIRRRQTVPNFDKTAFELGVNELSGIIRTNYGYHILEVTEKQSCPPYEEEKENLRQLFTKFFYKTDYNNYVDSLKKEFNYQANDKGLDYILSIQDTVKIDSDYWNSQFRKSAKDIKVFTIGNETYIFDSLMNRYVTEKKLNNKVLNRPLLNALVKGYSDEELFDKKVETLDKTDKTFAALMKDYKNGILVFKIHEDEIWNKIKSDSALLEKYYNEHRDDYKWDKRVSFSEIYVSSDSLINYCYDQLQNGADFDTLAAKYTERKGMKEKAGKYELMEVGKNSFAMEAAKLQNPGDYTKPFENGMKWIILKLNEKLEPRLKTFAEAKAEVATKFQELESKRLENEYINRLRETYKPVAYYGELDKISQQ